MNVRYRLRTTAWCAALLLLLAVAGCSNDDVPPATASLTMRSSLAAKQVGARGWERLWELVTPREAYAAAVTSADGDNLELTDFLLSIRDIKFLRPDDVGMDGGEVEIRGPFVVDLLSPAQPLSKFVAEAQVPADVYEGIRFVLHKSDGTPEPLLTNLSLYIAGTNTTTGTTFTIRHDVSENLNVFGPNGFQMQPGALSKVLVDIRLLSIFNSISTNSVLTGGNVDILPGNAFADAVKDAVKNAADVGKDSNDDGVLDESEDVG